MITLGQTLANLRGRPGRTFLTALGTALGIATIVALLAVVGGVNHSAARFVNLGPSEFGLFQRDAADLTTSILPTTLIPQLDRTPGIAAATPLVLLVNDVRKAAGAIVFGADARGFVAGGLVFGSGRPYRSGREIVLGDTLAAQLHVGLGQTLTVAHRRMLVVGIYNNGIAYQDAGAFVSSGTAQAISARQGEATTIVVKLDPATKPSTEQRTIARRFPGLEVITDAQQASRAGPALGGRVQRPADRWPRPYRRHRHDDHRCRDRTAARSHRRPVADPRPRGADVCVPQVTAWDLGRGLLVGVLLGILGGLYPAWRAAHVSPARVLAEH